MILRAEGNQALSLQTWAGTRSSGAVKKVGKHIRHTRSQGFNASEVNLSLSASYSECQDPCLCCEDFQYRGFSDF